MEMVRSMEPSELEVAALRLCLARKDEMLHSALELYRCNKDGDDLTDTLKASGSRTGCFP
jgi:hypothetical protein